MRSDNKRIVLQWILYHAEIKGNEVADFLAKKGNYVYNSQKQVLSEFFKKYIHEDNMCACRNNLMTKYEGKIGITHKISGLPLIDKSRKEVDK